MPPPLTGLAVVSGETILTLALEISVGVYACSLVLAWLVLTFVNVCKGVACIGYLTGYLVMP